MKPMNPEIKVKWLEALRGNEYGQSVGNLHDSSGFCCLGVLADLYIKAKGLKWKTYETDKGVEYYELHSCHQLLPVEVQRWAGLTMADPIIGPVASLAGMNDQGAKFDEIADTIEREL